MCLHEYGGQYGCTPKSLSREKDPFLYKYINTPQNSLCKAARPNLRPLCLLSPVSGDLVFINHPSTASSSPKGHISTHNKFVCTFTGWHSWCHYRHKAVYTYLSYKIQPHWYTCALEISSNQNQIRMQRHVWSHLAEDIRGPANLCPWPILPAAYWNTFHMATIISLGCKRKKRSIVKTCI